MDNESHDNLDKAVLACVQDGAASVGQIADRVGRAYSTVLLRCLKMETQGILRSTWCHQRRLFSPA
jgi:DNA-binding Lrp family transcriptional regulator